MRYAMLGYARIRCQRHHLDRGARANPTYASRRPLDPQLIQRPERLLDQRPHAGGELLDGGQRRPLRGGAGLEVQEHVARAGGADQLGQALGHRLGVADGDVPRQLLDRRLGLVGLLHQHGAVDQLLAVAQALRQADLMAGVVDEVGGLGLAVGDAHVPQRRDGDAAGIQALGRIDAGQPLPAPR